MKRALFIGRFQPFHKGHLYAVKRILEEAEELIIIVGSAQMSHELDNPFTAGERIEMIRRALDAEGIDRGRYMLIPIPDAPAHTVWVSMVESQTPRFDVVYTNQPLTRRLMYEAGYEVRGIKLYERERYEATEIRRRILAGGDWRELVPEEVYRYLLEIDGVSRIRDLAKSDRVEGG
jgi:nicotinamide-nucleotide adenylyltransferase